MLGLHEDKPALIFQKLVSVHQGEDGERNRNDRESTDRNYSW